MNDISRQELKNIYDHEGNILLLNVLPEDTYEKEHIHGSLNAPVADDDFVRHVQQLAGSKDQPIVTYCAGPACPASKKAAEALERAGFTDVKAYEGGMEDWKAAGYPLEGTQVQGNA